MEVSRKEQERAISVVWTEGWLVKAMELEEELRSQQTTTRDREVTELGLASSESQKTDCDIYHRSEQTRQAENNVETEASESPLHDTRNHHSTDAEYNSPGSCVPLYTLCFIED